MDESHPLGTLARLWRYPTKSLQAEPLTTAAVTNEGLAGDRRRALFVATAGHARSDKTYRGKENNLLHTVATEADARALGAARGVVLDVRDDGPYFDDAPVSLVFDAWLRELETLTGMELDPLRFRPNLYVRAAADFAASEADLVGATLTVGTVPFAVTSTTIRCVTPSYDVVSGHADPAMQRTLVQRRDNVLGVYCRPLATGSIALGAAVAARPGTRGPTNRKD